MSKAIAVLPSLLIGRVFEGTCRSTFTVVAVVPVAWVVSSGGPSSFIFCFVTGNSDRHSSWNRLVGANLDKTKMDPRTTKVSVGR